MGFPAGENSKESASQFRRCNYDRFDAHVRKILRIREWRPTLAFPLWKVPWTEEPGGLQSMGSQRVGHN